MSRYDREAAFFDGLHNWGKAHPKLDVLAGLATGMALYTVFMVGPFVGWMSWHLLGDFDPDNGVHVVLGALGGSAVCTAVTVAIAELQDRRRRPAQESAYPDLGKAG